MSRRRPPPRPDIHDELAALRPPRKHYQWYYSTRPANADMWNCPQGVHAFLRAYYHHKSADWSGNRPFPLIVDGRRTGEDADLLHHGSRQNMAETVAPRCRQPAGSRPAVAARERLARLQRRIRAHRLPGRAAMVSLPHRRRFRRRAAALLRPHDRPAVIFIAGKSDWGVSAPGRLRAHAGDGVHADARLSSVDGAGHWVQQEQPEGVSELLLRFLQAQ